MTPTPSVRESVRTSIQGLRSPPTRSVGQVGRCLAVSADERLLEGMMRAAATAGWDISFCKKPETSLRQAFLERYALAIVDVSPSRHRRMLKDLFRLVSDSSKGLVIACDKHSDPATELWARECGVWLYVPGAADWEELANACREAGRIHHRIGNRGAQGAPA